MNGKLRVEWEEEMRKELCCHKESEGDGAYFQPLFGVSLTSGVIKRDNNRCRFCDVAYVSVVVLNAGGSPSLRQTSGRNIKCCRDGIEARQKMEINEDLKLGQLSVQRNNTHTTHTYNTQNTHNAHTHTHTHAQTQTHLKTLCFSASFAFRCIIICVENEQTAPSSN